MTIFNINIWIILAILSVVVLIVFWQSKNAVWGGFTTGAFIGLIVAIVFLIIEKGFSWSFIYKGAIIGVFVGVVADLLGRLSDVMKQKRQLRYLSEGDPEPLPDYIKELDKEIEELEQKLREIISERKAQAAIEEMQRKADEYNKKYGKKTPQEYKKEREELGKIILQKWREANESET